MVSKRSLLVLVAGLLVAGAFIGATAFTTATVDRDVRVGIDADDAAIIGLQPGTADAATLTSTGELVISPETGSSNGLNQNATFTYGDDSSASAAASSYAFNVTNNDDAAHDFTLSYAQSQGSGTVEFVVAYDSTGDGAVDNTTTVTESSSATVNLASGATAYVVVTVDTGAGTTTIEGTLGIDAT